jgi:hypothetical protein
MEGHDLDTILPTAIQIQALQAAEYAGISVPRTVADDAQNNLKMASGKFKEKAEPGQSRSRQTDIAAALACRSNFHDGAMGDLWFEWLGICQTEIPVGPDIKFGRDELTLYYYAQSAFILGGRFIDDRTATFDHLQSTQNQDGSWPPADGISVGPVYSTAVWCTILQLVWGSHPSTLSYTKTK